MKKIGIFLICFAIAFSALAPFTAHGKERPVAISIYPTIILPGDPVFITVNSTSSVKSIYFDNKNLATFNYDGKTRALIGIDFNEKILKHTVKVKLADGSIITKPLTLTARRKIERPLGIPEKLGGNTMKAEKNLLTNLAKENRVLNTVKTSSKNLWSRTFVKPLANLKVTDDYGYDRKTVNSTIVHKGTDFRASVGTDVFAMNDGVVRIAREFVVYGNSVIIDHGLGLQTLYMHLSKLDVKEGDVVKAGQVIGQSGKTGYADEAHLHISIKINGLSIDPMTFMGFFGIKNL